MILRETVLLVLVFLWNHSAQDYIHSGVNNESGIYTFGEVGCTTGNIPPRPNASLTATARPDPYDTDDPSTKAKLTLRHDLFSSENGEILFYALLVALKEYQEPPTNDTWNITSGWPEIPNWELENTSYQVTPVKWNPFQNLTPLQPITFVLGDGTCDHDNYYCNKPLRVNTQYSLKIRAFTGSGYQDTDILHFKTLDVLPVTKIVTYLGILFLVTVVAVSLSIFDFGWIKRITKFRRRKVNESSPVPETLSLRSFVKYTQELISTPGRLSNEFHLLGTLSSDVTTLCLHAQRVDNRIKNRYGNILPFDITRVKLSVIDDDPSTDYINASFIRGFKNEIQYIATQGPKEETCHDFYRMIAEQNVELIVMLTELYENGREKCFKYYPALNETLKFKNIRVVCRQIVDLDVCIKRVFVISISGKLLKVTQLHIKNWPDFETPENPEVMLKFCDIINKQVYRGYKVVHCSAGSGRTGTYIAIDILLQELKTNNKISVFNTVLKLRQQRINMVQTETQLGFIYKCISAAIERSLTKVRESV